MRSPFNSPQNIRSCRFHFPQKICNSGRSHLQLAELCSFEMTLQQTWLWLICRQASDIRVFSVRRELSFPLCRPLISSLSHPLRTWLVHISTSRRFFKLTFFYLLVSSSHQVLPPLTFALIPVLFLLLWQLTASTSCHLSKSPNHPKNCFQTANEPNHGSVWSEVRGNFHTCDFWSDQTEKSEGLDWTRPWENALRIRLEIRLCSCCFEIFAWHGVHFTDHTIIW